MLSSILLLQHREKSEKNLQDLTVEDFSALFCKELVELADFGWARIAINSEFCAELKKSAIKRFNSGFFNEARTHVAGESNKKIRGDQICWLPLPEPTLAETRVSAFLDLLASVLRSHFRTGISHWEAHYAIYRSGRHYDRHVDITPTQNMRKFTFLIYLNERWHDLDGGNIKAYEAPTGESVLFRLKPESGFVLIFRSDISHEVEATHQDRYSFSGWFRS